jgi:TIR domain
LDEKRLLPGDDISRELESGIRLWDKFLLCASKNSLTSPWVEEEIETTLEKERALRSERGEKVFTRSSRCVSGRKPRLWRVGLGYKGGRLDKPAESGHNSLW